MQGKHTNRAAAREWTGRSPSAPHLVTDLPGPQARQVISLDEQFTSPSYTRDYPLVAARGSGAVLEDVDGNRFLDFTAGIAVCATGHCHPAVVGAIQRQSEQLLHMSGTDFYYRPQAELARKLATLAPCRGPAGDQPAKVFFTNSGAESVEAAVKLARRHTGRSRLIAFRGAFHGRTLGALSLTGSKRVQREGFGPLLPGVTHIEYPRCRTCPQQAGHGRTARAPNEPRIESGACCLRGLDDLEQAFTQTVPPSEVAAIVVEVIQGEGGYVPAPPEFLQRLQAIAAKHDILLIADEVQSGMGRTGRMFASEHYDFHPDIVCIAKGIASGMPLGAIVAREDVMTWPPGSHASTFGGNPVCCAAALATIQLLEDGLMQNAAQQGDRIMSALQAAAGSEPRIADVRGKGLMIGVELADVDGGPDPALRARVLEAAFRRGLLLLGCGVSTVRLCPPLIIDENQADTAVRILLESLAAC